MKRNGFFSSTTIAIAAALVLGALLAAGSVWAQNKVYRWVDENGEVHYSESLPPDFEGETHDELGQDGIVREEDVSRVAPPPVVKEPETNDGKTPLPRDKSGLQRPEPKYTDAEKQQHMDRLLMLRYHSEAELVEAMEVEINQLKYDEQLLTATRQSLQTSLKSTIDTAGNRQRAGLAVNEQTLKDLARIRAQIAENDRSLRGLQKREENIRADFNRDITRYRELVEMHSTDEETG